MRVYSVEKKQLSAKGMLAKVRGLFEKIPEPVKDPRGVRPKISLPDCLMSGLAVFGIKFPSLLQFDIGLNNQVIQHNLRTLYLSTILGMGIST